MRTTGRESYHRRRAIEERKRATLANNPAAKDSHLLLARFHARYSQNRDFVPFAKASRAGQPDSYWAAAHLSRNVTADDEESAAESGELAHLLGKRTAPAEALSRRSGPALIKLLGRTFAPAYDDNEFPLPASD
jgi:hypothetical protein